MKINKGILIVAACLFSTIIFGPKSSVSYAGEQRDIYFKYVGWTKSEITELERIRTRDYHLIKQVFGEPFFTGTITIQKGGNFDGRWDGKDTLYLRQVKEHTWIHELSHAFYGDKYPQNAAFSEGFAEAVTFVVEYLRNNNDPYILNMAGPYQQMNKPEISAYHCNYVSSMSLPPQIQYQRYFMAAIAWLKCYRQDRLFFVKFNKAYYKKVVNDEEVRNNFNLLVNLASQVVPRVEHLPFNQWFKKQSIFSYNPNSGYQLYLMAARYNPETSRIQLVGFLYRRLGNGDETVLPHIPLFVRVYTGENNNIKIAEGAYYPTDSNGLFVITEKAIQKIGDVPNPNPYKYLVSVEATIGKTKVVKKLFCVSRQPTAFDTSMQQSRFIFGAITNGYDGGSVEVLYLNGNFPTISTNVVHGAYVVEGFKDCAGEFLILYRSPQGKYTANFATPPLGETFKFDIKDMNK